MNKNKIFCSLCLQKQKNLGNKGHLWEVSNFSSTISIGNLNLHLSAKHDIESKSEEQAKKIFSFMTMYRCDETDVEASLSHEIIRDIVIWLCWDLMPCDLVEKVGFQSFAVNVMPQVIIPSSDTRANAALENVFQAIRHALEKKLQSVKLICLSSMVGRIITKLASTWQLGLHFLMIRNSK